MLCTERGVLKNSYYFFFSPSEDFLSYNYGIVNCGHLICQYGYKVQREGYSCPLLVYVVSGKFHLQIEDKEFTAEKDEIILIDCSKPHTYYVDHNCDFYYFHFAGLNCYNVANMLINKNNSPIFSAAESTSALTPLKECITKLIYNQEVSDRVLSCIAYEILCFLQTSSDPFTSNSNESSSVVSMTTQYIKSHISELISLEDLANHVNLSVYYFSHIFKKETGITPMESVSINKINYAKSILKTTDYSISQISFMSGYSSDSSFIKAFKKRVGISPARFRKQSDY